MNVLVACLSLLVIGNDDGLLPIAMGQGDDGYCSGVATPCSSIFTATTCTDSSSFNLCPTFLDSCEAICEREGATGYNSPCRCRLSPMGCTGGMFSSCDSRISCEGFANCATLRNYLDCEMTRGCEWTRPSSTVSPSPSKKPTGKPSMIPTREPTTRKDEDEDNDAGDNDAVIVDPNKGGDADGVGPVVNVGGGAEDDTSSNAPVVEPAGTGGGENYNQVDNTESSGASDNIDPMGVDNTDPFAAASSAAVPLILGFKTSCGGITLFSMYLLNM